MLDVSVPQQLGNRKSRPVKQCDSLAIKARKRKPYFLGSAFGLLNSVSSTGTLLFTAVLRKAL
jgi:hypothetical protein